MPVVDLLIRPDFATATAVAAGSAGAQNTDVSALPGPQFGDVLSHSIDTASQPHSAIAPFRNAPSSFSHSEKPQSGNSPSGNVQPGYSHPANPQTPNQSH